MLKRLVDIMPQLPHVHIKERLVKHAEVNAVSFSGRFTSLSSLAKNMIERLITFSIL